MRFWNDLSKPWLATIIMLLLTVVGWSLFAHFSSPAPNNPDAGRPVLVVPGQTAPLDVANFPTSPPASRPANCKPIQLSGASGAWVADWMDGPGLTDQVPQQAKKLDLLDFYWLSLGAAPNTILHNPGNPSVRSLNEALGAAQSGNPCSLRFVTITDDATGNPAGIEGLKPVLARILFDGQARYDHVHAMAAEMARHPLADGLSMDYEYALPQNQADLALYAQIGHLEQLPQNQLIDRISSSYADLMRDLALAMHHQGRLLRVAALVRTTDEVDTSNLAAYIADYGRLARETDQLILMAYDFHWSTGDPGPIAPIENVSSAWQYAVSYGISSDKLSLALPNYGYDWVVDAAGKNPSKTPASPVTASDLAAASWSKTAERDNEVRLSYQDGQGQSHEVWETTSDLSTKAAQTKQLCGCPLMAWKIGNADPVGSNRVLAALG